MMRTLHAKRSVSPLIALLLCAPCVGLSLTGCDGDTPPEDSATPGPDAGPTPERQAPTIVETTPSEGSLGVARGTAFEARFSEAMGTEGNVSVRVEGEVFEADVSLGGDTLLVSPADGWPAGSEVEVRVDTGFADEAGNALDRAYVFRFTTQDDAAPTVASSVPAEGDADVVVRLGAIRLRFSEPMDQAAGAVTLEGGPGTLVGAEPVWSAEEVVYAVEGLAHDVAYRVVLDGFRDRTGNPLDGTVTLEDGALDFTTRADDEAPRAVASTPNEAQVDVLLATLGGAIEVRFDEAMDETVATAPLTVGGTTDDAAITWVDARTARFDVVGMARNEAAHSLDLRGLTDVVGNALSTEPLLIDGRLDFTTGVDRSVPFVAASSPTEGALSVAIPLARVELGFSEAMDQTDSDVMVTDDLARTSTVTGTWRSGGTVLELPGSAFTPGRTFKVDASALRDLSGTTVSTAHVYLGDGQLDFSLEAPTGASCAEPLLMENADSVAAGRFLFEVTNEQRTGNNGSGVCDPNGIADTDAVLLYRKTTPALGDASGTGRALRILTFNVSNRVNVDVLSGVCDPRDPTAGGARQVCMSGHASVDQFLDLPAGDHYIWVSTADGSASDIDLGIEEVDAIPEGEACGDPYDAASPSHTAPASAGEPHVWELPGGPGNSLDIATTNSPFAAISCREEPFGDVVIEYTKLAADTVLDVRVTGAGFGVTAEVVSGACRPDDGGTRAACESFVSSSVPERLTAEATAGPVYIWLAGTSSSSAFPGGRVEVRELPAATAPGSSCASAIPITPGASVAITPTHAERYFAPSCVPTDANVTWYAFDTVEELTQVRTLGVGATGLVDAGTAETFGCSTNATSSPLARFAPVGTRLCVAVESSSGVTGLAIDSIDYQGVGVTAPVRLDIAPPDLDGTLYAGFSITGDDWLAATPTTLYQNMGTAGMLTMSAAGGARAGIRFDVDGRILGRAAWAVGESLFVIEQSSAGSRFFRLTDTLGAWSPEVMDPGADYPEHTYALTHDGADFYTMVRESTATVIRDFPIYRLSDDAPAPPVVVGRIDTIYQTAGIAADAEHFYIAGATSSATSARGIYRVRRADLSADLVTTPTSILPLAFSTSSGVPMRLSDTGASPRYLYVRSGGGVHVIESPASATPRYLGVIFQSGSADYAMDIEPASGAMVVFGTHEDLEGDWYRLDL